MKKKDEIQIVLEISHAVKAVPNGFEYIMSRKISEHPDDWYLYRALARKDDNNFVVWTYNATTEGLNNGHYGMSQDDTYKLYME